MRTYTTHQTITLATGQVELSAAQAAARQPCLRHIEDDTYEIQAPIQFKADETFGYEGDIPKGVLAGVEETEEEGEEPKPKSAKGKAKKSKPNKDEDA